MRPTTMKRRGVKGAGIAPDGECDASAARDPRGTAADRIRPARIDPHPRPLRPHGRSGEVARLCDGFPSRRRDLLGLSPRCGASRISHRKTPRLAKRSEEHTSELQSLMRNSYAVFCLNKKN